MSTIISTEANGALQAIQRVSSFIEGAYSGCNVLENHSLKAFKAFWH